MNTYVILRRQGWANLESLEKAAGRSTRVGHEEMPGRVRWIRSYIVREPDGRLGEVAICQGTDPETVREHARRAHLPCDEIVPVFGTVVINDDPAEAA